MLLLLLIRRCMMKCKTYTFFQSVRSPCRMVLLPWQQHIRVIRSHRLTSYVCLVIPEVTQHLPVHCLLAVSLAAHPLTNCILPWASRGSIDVIVLRTTNAIIKQTITFPMSFGLRRFACLQCIISSCKHRYS